MMTNPRILTWDGCVNVRDLGGLPAAEGYQTRWGALVRSDHPAKLSAAGWQALYDHGIRTVVSLRTHGLDEPLLDAAPRPAEIESLVVEIEDVTDLEFRTQWASSDLWCTPMYYRDAFQRWPERHAAALKTIANARPGGVLFHCKRGHDRTGIISLLLLALVGVAADDILADYELSVDPEREEILAREGTTTRAVLLATLASLEPESYLRQGGFTPADLEALRARFLEPRPGLRP